MVNFTQDDTGKFTVPGTTKMIMNSKITLVFQDGEVELDVSSEADLKDTDPRFHEDFMRMLENQYRGIKLYMGYKMDGTQRVKKKKPEPVKKLTRWQRFANLYMGRTL